MTSTRASSTSIRTPAQPERRDWRRVSTLSVSSPVESRPTNYAQPSAITEEINEVKRYEDFTTIDWVQDAVHEQARRKAKHREGSKFWEKEGTFGWRRKVRESYDAGQAWLVITLVGAAIGLNSALLNIITEWLSDVKLGYCTTAFYLNEQFCCWGAEGGMDLFTGTLALEGDEADCDRVLRVEELDFRLAYQLCFVYLLCGTCLSCLLGVSNVLDVVRLHCGETGQVFCPVCRWFRYIGDQMHHYRFRDEGIPRGVDAPDQVDYIAVGHWFRSLHWKGGTECSFCCLYRERDLPLLQQVQAECLEN